MRAVSLAAVLVAATLAGAADPRGRGAPAARPASPSGLRSGLVALWSGDGHAEDAAGTHHGAAVNVSYTADRHDTRRGAFSFDGEKGLVTAPDTAGLDSDEAFTLSAWICPVSHTDSEGQEGTIVAKWLDTKQQGDYAMYLDRQGRLCLIVSHSDNGYAFATARGCRASSCLRS